MHDLALSVLGPYSALPPAVTLLLVWLNRRALRKRHVVMLFLLTALASTAFLVLVVLGLARWNVNPTLYMTGLYASAAVAVGCGPATLFAWVLAAYFPSEEARAENPVRMPQRPPRPSASTK